MREIKKVAACSCYIDGGYKFSMRKWNGAAISQSITRGTGDVPLLKRTHWYKVNILISLVRLRRKVDGSGVVLVDQPTVSKPVVRMNMKRYLLSMLR